jgi:uncharacterized protein YfaS (alpha-2-macroglobulin family)
MLDSGGERLEVISLLPDIDPQSGELSLEISLSLGAVLWNSLEVLENDPYASTEWVVSRALSNLELAQALQSFGLFPAEQQEALDRHLNDALNLLISTQKENGGWGWWPDQGESDQTVTAYALFGLSQMRQAGMNVPNDTMIRAAAYLQGEMISPTASTATWVIDRYAFSFFALAQSGADLTGDLEAKRQSVFELRSRLNPWSAALLALSYEPGSEQMRTLLSDLQSRAIRSATSTFWEETSSSYLSFSSPVTTTAMVVYALAHRDPASSLLPDAVRYLVAHRQADGGWNSSYETAWTLLALSRYMAGTGEMTGSYQFNASVNGVRVAEGNASPASLLAPVQASVPLDDLYPDQPNAVVFYRDSGGGRLYYRLYLDVSLPVEQVEGDSRGIYIDRSYTPLPEDCPDDNCEPINRGQAGEMIQARLTLTLPHDVYYLVVEDFLPGGSEVLNTRLQTSQQMLSLDPSARQLYDPNDPFADGWGWWWFNDPLVYDERIAWTVENLPAGTYQLTYTLVLNSPGEYRVLPPQAYQMYFPEVHGQGAGQIFMIGE